jgi:hypothetical protein
MTLKDTQMALRSIELSGVTLDTIRERLFGWEDTRLQKIEDHKLQLEEEDSKTNPDVLESTFAPDLAATYRQTEPRTQEEVIADLLKYESRTQ